MLVAAAALALAGCSGGEKKPEALTFEKLPDTTGLSRGEPILGSFEASRMNNGAVRVSGHVRLPDGTRLQIAIRNREGACRWRWRRCMCRERVSTRRR
jgi:hypothetical protein